MNTNDITSISTYQVVIEPFPQTSKIDLDIVLKRKLDTVFSKVKGKKKNVKSMNGELNIDSIINYQTNKNQNLVFDREIATKGGHIVILVDGSGTMRFDNRMDKVRRLTASLFQSLSDVNKINFEVIMYGGSFVNPEVLAITKIAKFEDLSKLEFDAESHGSTPTHKAVHYVTEHMKKLKGKKLLITITDGKPEVYKNHKALSIDLSDSMREAYLNAENHNINVFGIGIGLYDIPKFNKIFRQNFINVENVDECHGALITQLSRFVAGLK